MKKPKCDKGKAEKEKNHCHGPTGVAQQQWQAEMAQSHLCTHTRRQAAPCYFFRPSIKSEEEDNNNNNILSLQLLNH